MGEKVFSVAEAEKIRHLLQRKVQATRSEQKVIRASIRRLGFYISDFTSSTEGFTASDFDDLVERGEITIAEGPRQEPSRTLLKSPNRIPITINKMKQREECVVLPDVLETGMKVVFCGTAVGDKSARRGAYYAGSGNQFWDILADTGLTPHRFAPEQYPSLLKFKIGLTDLVKGRSGQDVQLSAGDFDVSGFRAKIEKHAPKAVAFNGKKAAQLFFDSPSVEYGPQKEKIGPTALFVLPSTSGAARGFWDPKYWFQLAEFVGVVKLEIDATA